MEGLIPYLYKAIIQHKEGQQQQGANEPWFYGSSSSSSSPSAAYTRLPSGDSGRFQPVSDINISSTTPSQVIISSSTEMTCSPPTQCLTSRHGINVHDLQPILMH
ncbi:hypothetical protein SOVF_082550 [Spinacia oleracea]|nr:hypothetical protein SOVF_082550 [Spinacia oleracea]